MNLVIGHNSTQKILSKLSYLLKINIILCICCLLPLDSRAVTAEIAGLLDYGVIINHYQPQTAINSNNIYSNTLVKYQLKERREHCWWQAALELKNNLYHDELPPDLLIFDKIYLRMLTNYGQVAVGNIEAASTVVSVGPQRQYLAAGGSNGLISDNVPSMKITADDYVAYRDTYFKPRLPSEQIASHYRPSNKLRYLSPRIFDLQLALSFSPNDNRIFQRQIKANYQQYYLPSSSKAIGINYLQATNIGNWYYSYSSERTKLRYAANHGRSQLKASEFAIKYQRGKYSWGYSKGKVTAEGGEDLLNYDYQITRQTYQYRNDLIIFMEQHYLQHRHYRAESYHLAGELAIKPRMIIYGQLSNWQLKAKKLPENIELNSINWQRNLIIGIKYNFYLKL